MRPLLSNNNVLCSIVLLGVVSHARIIGRKLRNEESCNTPGFFGDSEDCRKFYRCAEHPTEDPDMPHLIRYSFRCPNGTVFDEMLSTCNHPEAVMDKPANCQVYDPDEGQSEDDGSYKHGTSYSSFLGGNSLASYGNQAVLQQQLQPQQLQLQQLQSQQINLPNSQVIYIPTLTVPYENLIQYG